jgi:ribosome biogenesis ATPase
METRRDVFVIAATNRPDMIDAAMLRPGRLDKLLYVPLPDPSARLGILQTCGRKTPFGPDVDLIKISSDPRCDGYRFVKRCLLCCIEMLLR